MYEILWWIMLDKYLLELMQKRNKTKLSLNDAIEALLEEHYSKTKA
jgi:hypothetical protein